MPYFCYSQILTHQQQDELVTANNRDFLCTPWAAWGCSWTFAESLPLLLSLITDKEVIESYSFRYSYLASTAFAAVSKHFQIKRRK